MTIGEAVFVETTQGGGSDTMNTLKLEDGGRITVLHRLTGYGCGDIFDTETGYRSKEGKFWLASGRFDIREWPEKTIEEAVEFIKAAANTCIGD